MSINHKPLQGWTGNIGQLACKVRDVLREAEPPPVRLIRDYIQRGVLGSVRRAGRELLFDYGNLLRFVAARVLLREGWSLGKIVEHLSQCSTEELEAFLPQSESRALAAQRRTGQESLGLSELEPISAHLRKAAALSTLQIEMREALRCLGLPEDGPATEAVTLIAIAPWFQALVTTGRIARITPQEAEEIGRAVTASLHKLARRKEFRK